MIRRVAMFAVAVGLTGCLGDAEEGRAIEVVPGPDDDAGAGGQPSFDAAPPLEAGEVVRTVEVRNPFGNAGVEDNLLVDGDFEFTGPSGQMGWRSLAGGGAGDSTLRRETGGACRSGVVCGVLERGNNLLGFGAAPPNAPVEVSIWGKPGAPDCELLNVSLISCTSLSTFTIAEVPPINPVPDESGWCNYRGVSPEMDEQACLFLTPSNSIESPILIDEALLRAGPPTAQMSLRAIVPTAARQREISSALEWEFRNRWFGRLPKRESGQRPDPSLAP